MRYPVFLLTLLAMLLSSGCRSPQTDYSSSGQSVSELEWAVLRGVNDYRLSRGLDELRYDRVLAEVARDHSESMAARRSISHRRFQRRFDRLKPDGIVGLAENLAMNGGYSDPAGATISGWDKSPGHYRNLVSREYQFTGVGVARDRNGALYFTQLFGKR